MISKKIFFILISSFFYIACDSDDNDPATDSNRNNTLSKAFEEFDTDNTTIILDGNEVIIEANGLPNHNSPYWSSPNHTTRPGSSTPTETHPLFIAPTVTTYKDMAPGFIDDFNGSYTLRVPANPSKASSSTATGLGAIGIAVSGAVIYNDQEGPNVPLDNAAPSLDYSGAHTGPQSYHYHLEPTAWSQDDDKLIGIIADGFLLYGRKCTSTGNYPNDLDTSGGHTSITAHSTEDIYHYHIQNELYLNQYYILFPGNYQGTPNAIN
ncbi:MAG: YHYH protein [Bacteroidota bacterium]